MGYTAVTFADYYFITGNFGFSFDVRFIHHRMVCNDALELQGGILEGVVMLQQFPSYMRLLNRFHLPDDSKARIETRYLTCGAPDVNAWAMLSVFRFNYRHNPKVSFFAQGDYMAIVGKTFFGKPNRFSLRHINTI